jgi:hypothetical protein
LDGAQVNVFQHNGAILPAPYQNAKSVTCCVFPGLSPGF